MTQYTCHCGNTVTLMHGQQSRCGMCHACYEIDPWSGGVRQTNVVVVTTYSSTAATDNRMSGVVGVVWKQEAAKRTSV
jgi:hypothetical protein